MKNICYLLSCLICYILLLSSCGSYKKVPYFQDLQYSNGKPESIENFTPITIQPADILSVSVNSLNPLAYNDSIGRVVGYSVDQEENIKVPLIGSVKVSGLTLALAERDIQQRLSPFLKNPEVVVHMKNFKVAVLGDVAKPNVYPVLSERMTIVEALALAGDLNITAKRKNILLVREVSGTREYVPIDLTSAKLFTSPYFYLKHNDMIYVQPDKSKYAAVDRGYQTFSLALSALSVVAILLTNLL